MLSHVTRGPTIDPIEQQARRGEDDWRNRLVDMSDCRRQRKPDCYDPGALPQLVSNYDWVHRQFEEWDDGMTSLSEHGVSSGNCVEIR